MIKYKVIKSAMPIIRKQTVDRETEKCVFWYSEFWKSEQKESKESEGHIYFGTFEEARNYAIQYLNERIQRTTYKIELEKENINSYKNRIVYFEKLTEV